MTKRTIAHSVPRRKKKTAGRVRVQLTPNTRRAGQDRARAVTHRVGELLDALEREFLNTYGSTQRVMARLNEIRLLIGLEIARPTC